MYDGKSPKGNLNKALHSKPPVDRMFNTKNFHDNLFISTGFTPV